MFVISWAQLSMILGSCPLSTCPHGSLMTLIHLPTHRDFRSKCWCGADMRKSKKRQGSSGSGGKALAKHSLAHNVAPPGSSMGPRGNLPGFTLDLPPPGPHPKSTK